MEEGGIYGMDFGMILRRLILTTLRWVYESGYMLPERHLHRSATSWPSIIGYSKCSRLDAMTCASYPEWSHKLDIYSDNRS